MATPFVEHAVTIRKFLEVPLPVAKMNRLMLIMTGMAVRGLKKVRAAKTSVILFMRLLNAVNTI
tara:strand:+ start:25196 stop:25387 length:192 start_codon:yes stop_codon:yes gene_type:complete